MRPVRVTGVTGTSAWVPLDTYAPAPASVTLTGAGGVEYTLDDPFAASPSPVGKTLTLATGAAVAPMGARAVRGTGMAGADVLTVSQQGIT